LNPLHNLVIKDTYTFNKAVKKLKKKYKHIENDYMAFVNEIQAIDDLGVNLGNGVYKVRIANTDKNSGKSSGYRLISYLKMVDNVLYLMFIYDKSEMENISEKEIDALILESLSENN